MEKDLTIPYILYKTGPFDTVTHPEIVECFQENEKMLQCKIEYSNDGNCYNFIKNHFDANVVKAYDMLIPGAYKADLWRLCVLYIHGGIYGDLTQTFLREYDVNKDNADIILVKDRAKYGIYNAFMAAKQHNGFIKYCIEKIAQQILMRNRGNNGLDITGPSALRRHYLKFFNVNKINLGLQELTGIDNKIYTINVPFYHVERTPGMQVCVTENNKIIINNYLTNRERAHKLLDNNRKTIHYSQAYKENKVFKLNEMEVRRLRQQQQQQRSLNLQIRKRHLQYQMLNNRRRRIYKKRFMIMK